MPFGSLWIPVVVSAIVVFVASSIIHMALKYHKFDLKRLPNEDAVREVLAKGSLAPGMYFTPYCEGHKQLKEPAFAAKFETGPIAIITSIKSGMPKMGKSLSLWFGFCFLVSFVAAYIARHTLMPGVVGMLPMQVTGTVAFAAYGLSSISDSIWKGAPWSNTARAMLDGVIYAVLTGLVFRLLWPAA
jgi:hypothetical protein